MIEFCFFYNGVSWTTKGIEANKHNSQKTEYVFHEAPWKFYFRHFSTLAVESFDYKSHIIIYLKIFGSLNY